MTGSGAGSFCFLWGWRLLLVGRYPPACCSSRLPVFSLRLLQKVNGAQCQQLSLAVSLAWLKPSYQGRRSTHTGAAACDLRGWNS